MFTDNVWISNEFKKTKNPAKILGVNDIYQGVLPQDYDFKFQTKNFTSITNSLAPFDIYPTELYSSYIKGKHTFIVCFSNPNLIWHKYENEGYGSCQNHIYYKSQKIKVTQWIKFTEGQIKQLLLS